MQNVEKELPGLIRELLQSPSHKQRALIERHYTPDCRLTHALVIGENREEIVRIFQAWRFANRRLDVDVNEIVLNAGGTRAYCTLTQHVQPAGPFLKAYSRETVVVLDLVSSPAGKLIGKHDDITKANAAAPAAAAGLGIRDPGMSGSRAGHLCWCVGGQGHYASLAFEAAVVAIGGDAGPVPPYMKANGARSLAAGVRA